jgi:dolichol-phosphate mannosyltransferase
MAEGLPSFAVVIPMFNEEAGARRCILEVFRVLDELPNRATLIAVDDGSTDNTLEILQSFQDEDANLRLVKNEANLGYGAALKAGVAEAALMRLDYVVFMDSDLTNDPADIRRFVEEMGRGTDVIKASRYVEGGSVAGVPLRRRLVSHWGNIIGRALFRVGIRDCTNGFRAVKTNIVASMSLREDRFAIIVEELYLCTFAASTFAEIPVVLGNREQDQRSTAFSYGPSTFFKYLKYGFLSFLRIPPPSPEGSGG